MPQVRTKPTLDDVIVQIRRFGFWVDYANLSSRARLVMKELNEWADKGEELLRELDAACEQLEVEKSDARNLAKGDRFGRSTPFFKSWKDLKKWIGSTKAIPEPDQRWRAMINHGLHRKFPYVFKKGNQQGGGKVGGPKPPPNVSHAGGMPTQPSGRSAYIPEDLARAGYQFNGVDQTIAFKKPGSGKGGNQKQSDAMKQRKKELRKENPNDSGMSQKEYEEFIHELYLAETENDPRNG